jgi:hypothetical protein
MKMREDRDRAPRFRKSFERREWDAEREGDPADIHDDFRGGF